MTTSIDGTACPVCATLKRHSVLMPENVCPKCGSLEGLEMDRDLPPKSGLVGHDWQAGSVSPWRTRAGDAVYSTPHSVAYAALAAAALLYMEALPTRDDDENGLHEPIHNGPIQNTSDHATCDHGTCDHGASDTESRTCSELPIQKELVASEAARGVAGGEAGGSPSDPPSDPPSSALSLTLRTDPLLEVLLSPPKNKKNASSLSLPKCRTPTFAICPQFISKR